MEAVKAAFFQVAAGAEFRLILNDPEVAENRIKSHFFAILICWCLLFATIVLSVKLHYTTPILTGVGETPPDATKQDQACRL